MCIRDRYFIVPRAEPQQYLFAGSNNTPLLLSHPLQMLQQQSWQALISHPLVITPPGYHTPSMPHTTGTLSPGPPKITHPLQNITPGDNVSKRQYVIMRSRTRKWRSHCRAVPKGFDSSGTYLRKKTAWGEENNGLMLSVLCVCVLTDSRQGFLHIGQF